MTTNKPDIIKKQPIHILLPERMHKAVFRAATERYMNRTEWIREAILKQLDDEGIEV